MSKFEEGIIRFNGKERRLSVDQIVEMCKQHPEYIQEIKQNIFCPECGVAQLTLYLNSSDPFLKTKNYATHENCSLEQNVMKDKQFMKFLDKCEKYEDIEPYIENILRRLEERVEKPTCKFQNSNHEHQNERKKRVALPCKRIDRPLHDEDLQGYKCFYGVVNSKFETTKDKSWFKLYKPNSEKLLCTISATKSVCERLPKDIKCNLTNMDMVVICQMRKSNGKDNGQQIYRSHLRYSYYIIFRTHKMV